MKTHLVPPPPAAPCRAPRPDRSQDPNNLLYKESWTRIDYLGNVVGSGALAVPDSNPCAYATPCTVPFIFIGDYQDSWWWTFSDQYGNRFNATWTEQTSGTTGNIYVTGASSSPRTWPNSWAITSLAEYPWAHVSACTISRLPWSTQGRQEVGTNPCSKTALITPQTPPPAPAARG
jgi:hypothetical protein